MRFEANLTIAHVNVRREKAGEKRGPLAVDVKLSGKIGTAAFQPLLDGDEHAAALIEGLFDSEGNLRSNNFEHLPLTVEHKGLAVTLRAGPDRREFEVAQLNSISIEPDIGRTVKVDARLQLNAAGAVIAWLCEMLDYEVTVVAETKQQKLDLPPSKEKREPAPAVAH